VNEERGEILDVAILGPGSYSWNRLEQDVKVVLSETGIPAGLNHITDPKQMARDGIIINICAYLQQKGKIGRRNFLPFTFIILH
jgi:hypothetical protein